MFSSELKSFHKNPNFKKEQNLEVLPYFFQYGYIPAPYSIYKQCFKLEAGHYLELSIDDLQYSISKYWDVNDFYSQDKPLISEDKILEDIEDILEEAINLRMVSDVPVGIFLSGGYDSSLVASILAKKQKDKINTFTIGFKDKNYNEAEHAKSIAKYLGTNHTEYYMKETDMLDLIKDFPFYFDEPFGDSSALPTMIVSKIARQSVTVALSADGGDEAFCGYSKYFFLYKFKNIYSSPIKRHCIKLLLKILNINVVEKINRILPSHLKQTNIRGKYSKFRSAINSTSLQELFEAASSHVDKNEVSEFLKIKRNKKLFQKWNHHKNIDFLDMMMAIDYKLFLNDGVLTKTDRATMSVSLEGREPLLDHRIIEYMATIPSNLKYKKNNGKHLLRQILYKYIPKELIDKPKSGFSVPLEKWLRDELRPLVDSYICKEKLDHKIFDVNEIIIMKNRFLRGEDIGNQIWLILIYQLWKEKWLD
tara:strand:- start:270 stop:1703 length:1434 start_codon:yes stop_codon:yes gene_type:complete